MVPEVSRTLFFSTNKSFWKVGEKKFEISMYVCMSPSNLKQTHYSVLTRLKWRLVTVGVKQVEQDSPAKRNRLSCELITSTPQRNNDLQRKSIYRARRRSSVNGGESLYLCAAVKQWKLIVCTGTVTISIFQ